MPLFKYMTPEVAQLFTKNLSVRFTQPFEQNDLFEFRPMLDFVGTANDVRTVIEKKIDQMYGTVDDAFTIMEKRANDPKFPKLIAPLPVLRRIIMNNPELQRKFVEAMQQHKAELLDNARMAPFWEAEWEKFRQALGQALGIFSLTENPAHMLMWSHYASMHFGIVVEFNENHAWFNQRITPSDDLRHLVKVTYVQNPQPRTWKQVNGTDMLYTKMSEWSYESEWRMIRPLKDGTEVNPGIFCFDVPADALRGIIFGSRTKPDLEKDIRDSVATNPSLKHMWLKRAKPVNGGKIEIIDATS